MASSLEELLAEDGFRGRRSGMRSRASFKAETVSMPLNPFRDQRNKGALSNSSSHKLKGERTRSNVARHILRSELPRSNSSSSRNPGENLVRREQAESRLRTESWEGLGRRSSKDTREGRAMNADSSEEIRENEIVEVDVEEDERVMDVHSDKVHGSGRSKRSSKGNGERAMYRERTGKDIKEDTKHGANSSKNLRKYAESGDSHGKSMKHHVSSYDSSVRSSKNSKVLGEDRRQKHENAAAAVPKIALDEVAVQAVISILNGYIKRFLKDEEFRTMLHRCCFSSLNATEMEEGPGVASNVMTNFKEAIRAVEKAAEDVASTKELKKASLQLTVVTGLNLNGLKDGCTTGIPNSRLSACAHLYLSVIHKLHKKDRVSAKHLLQVWHDREADSLLNTPSKITKLRFLDKIYSEIMDSGTYQFAVYYKDWLTEGVEAPPIPSIQIPTISVQSVQQEGSHDHSLEFSSPSSPFSPQPMVSKKLYEAVFSHSSKPGVYEAEESGEAENFDTATRSSDGSAVQIKQTLAYSSCVVKSMDQEIEENLHNTFLPNHGLVLESKGQWKFHRMNGSLPTDLTDEANHTHILNISSHTKENELTLKNLAISAFQVHKTEDAGGLIFSGPSNSNKSIKARSSYEDLHGSYEYFDEGFFFASIPQDFVCPLTGKLFDNPVTLETGQTFEREAIEDWFSEGKKECPVTGKALKCCIVPHTNFILKRLIEGWKSERCNHLLDFASKLIKDGGEEEPRQRNETAVSMLEKLLTAVSMEERLTYARHLVSLGGLEFLIRRFEFGDSEEKTRVAALLLCCIHVDTGCKNQIARTIDKHGLFELLHSKQSTAMENAVFLLIELVCLRRRKDVTAFFNGIPSEKIPNAMDVLLAFLQCSSPEQRPSVAVLLLHLDLLVEPRKSSLYKEEAVNAIAVSLEGSTTDEKVRENSCRALLVLGGCFSSSGKLLTESWVLKQAGFDTDCDLNSEEYSLSLGEEEEEAREEWLRNLSVSLLGNGKESFLEAISKCLGSANLYLVGVCLITIAWMSRVLSSLADAEFHLSAFSALFSGLKESLENGKRIEHRVLASMSLLNFSRGPECGVLLRTIAREIAVPLRDLQEVTWTAKQLYATISGEDL